MDHMYLFDGAMGTMLQRYGLETGSCPDFYNLSHPDVVQHIHREYAEAGSQYITTNTFGSLPMKLSEYGLEDRLEDIAAAAVKNIRAAAGDKVKAAGDMGPTGQFIRPLGTLTFDETASQYERLARALERAGADCLIIETIIDIQEMRAALTAAKSATSLPVICQMSYSDDGRTITGTDPASAVILLDAMGADVIGANCSVGPDKLLSAARLMTAATRKPVIIQPNAGMPVLENGVTRFPLSPEDMAAYVKDFAEAGVSFLGGCCGTTPDHIRAIGEALHGLGLVAVTVKRPEPFTAFTSRTKTVYVGDAFPPVSIGERINPTGRKKLRADIQAGSFVSVKKEALAQIDAGADMLDVNMGVPAIDQAAAMEQAVTELSMLSPAPLSIDSTDPVVIERALKVYPGRALINSVNSDEALMDAVFPLAKRYGAAVLCLPLGKGGIPETAEARADLIARIMEKALSYGLRKEDILLDPLVLTAASGKTGARETLRTLKLYKERFGCPCVMGTSNVSFGLPDRPRINAAFLTMAFACGVNAPIVNPLDQRVQDAFLNARLLLGFDEGARAYIAAAAKETAAPVEETPKTGDPLALIRSAVIHGEKEEAASLMDTALKAGLEPPAIIKDGLTAAMTAIGKDYGAGKAYLPQVMMAAEAMQAAFTALKALLPDMKTEPKGTVAVATVKGDIHDLGKNIVAALLENSGYDVIDLGKDVDLSAIEDLLQKKSVDIVGLCSLMTTTLPELEASVAALKKDFPRVSVMVGGAVVTPDYAKKIGADAYAKDGIEAIHKADELTQK